MKRIFIFCLLIIGVYSCVNSNNQSELFNKQITSADSIQLFISEVYKQNTYLEFKPTKYRPDTNIWQHSYPNGNIFMQGAYYIDDSLNNGQCSYSYNLPDNTPREGYMCSVEYYEWQQHNLHLCKTGSWEFYHENGQLMKLSNFIKGREDGYEVELYESGTKKSEGTYEQGRKIGLWKTFYPNSQIQSIVLYDSFQMRYDEFWLKNGVKTLSDGTGFIALKRENDSIVIEYDNYILNGRYFQYRLDTPYDKSSYSGIKKYYIDMERYYTKGIPSGNWKFYGNAGKTEKQRVSRITPYVNGLRNGLSVRFFNDDTTSSVLYINGEMHGEYIRKHCSTLRMESIERWDMGKRHGVREYFDFDGLPELHQYYYHASFIGEVKFENGEIVSERIIEGNETEFEELRVQTTYYKNQ
jgi:antitoxin component YwqK of YwqJK toxin-antitoxin module